MACWDSLTGGSNVGLEGVRHDQYLGVRAEGHDNVRETMCFRYIIAAIRGCADGGGGRDGISLEGFERSEGGD